VCKESKSVSEFYRDSSRPDGLTYTCIACIKISRAKFQQDNKEKLSKYKQRHWALHKQEIAISKSKYYKLNRDKILRDRSKYYQRNRDSIIKQKNRYAANRRAVDPLFKLIHNLRRRVHAALASNYKTGKTIALLGCTPEALKNWLSYQFEEGMSWGNYGKWHIDHVIPCASFNMEDLEEQKKCFHWTNLQPLWAVDNLRKGAKYEQL